MRRSSLVVLFTLATAPALLAGERSAVDRLEFLGTASLEHRLAVEETPLGGLSALAWDSGRGVYYALSDDFSHHAPARFYTLSIDLADGRLDEGDVAVAGVTTLVDLAGEPFEPAAIDPEGLALAAGGRLFLSSEGHAARGVAPFVAELDLEGRVRRYLALPDRYLPRQRTFWRRAATGVRHNLALESLTLTPSEEWLFTANENALQQDGPPATLFGRSPVRISRFATASGRQVAEYLYWTEAVAERGVVPEGNPSSTDVLEVAGLVELLALDDDHLLALERSYSTGAGNTIRLFAVDLSAATEISGVPRLTRQPDVVSAKKTLLLDLDELGVELDNVEGLTFGPPLADGRRTLLLVSDDNFSERQTTQFLAFAVAFAKDEGRTTIAEIQGAAHRTALAGTWILGTPAVITAVEPREDGGFAWIEDPTGSAAEPGASSGLKVSTWSVEGLAPGQRVAVSGRVAERERRGALPVTMLLGGRFEPLEATADQPPVRLGDGGRPIPARHIDDDQLTRYEPDDDALDYFESLEGMRVEIADAVVVGPGNRFGECVVVADGGAGSATRSRRGGLLLGANDLNPERIIVSTTLLEEPCRAAVGDRFAGPIRGVMDYDFGSYRVLASESLPAVVTGPRPEVTATLRADEDHLTVATFNVENLRPGLGKLSALATTIVERLGAPDVLGLQEVQDANGPEDDGTTSAEATFEELLEAIVVAGGPRYDFHQVDPENNADGGQPGANIRVGYLIDPTRVRVPRRGRAGARDRSEISRDESGPFLSPNPGRVAPADPAFAAVHELGYRATRKPLALEIEFNGRRVFLINAHLKSKSGDDRLFGPRQPPVWVTEEQRSLQAARLRELADAILAEDANAAIVVLGDLNEHEFRGPLAVLTSSALVNLVERVSAEDRYTFNYRGNSQTLDHILVSPSLAAGAEIEILHLHADHPVPRASDHDPVLVRLPLPPTDPGLPSD